MKLIQRSFALFSLALLAGACDLQQTFEERIDDKQLLVLTPDFADTSVQLVIRDLETLAVIDEDFEVTIYANKRLVDLNGNYKNEFIARGGVMEFSVSPEETVTESDPLEISVYALSEDGTKIIRYHQAMLSNKGFNNLLLTSELMPNLSEIEANQSALQGNKIREEIYSNRETVSFSLTFNDKPIDIRYIDKYCESLGCIYRLDSGQEGVEKEYYSGINLLEKPLTVKVLGPPKTLASYSLFIYYTIFDYTKFGETRTEVLYKIEQDGRYFLSYNNNINKTSQNSKGILTNFNDAVLLPKDVAPRWFTLSSYAKEGYAACNEGFNLQFEGLAAGEETNLMYKATRKNDNKIFAIASFNINNLSSKYNSLKDAGESESHFIDRSSNRLEFAESAQYIIEPQVIDLGGGELCGKTFTVRLKRRDTQKKHLLNLSMRNENQNVGLALTFSALLRKQGQDNASWETVNFKQGSTSLFLEEGSTYEVKLTLADEPLKFTFTNDLSLVEAAVQATLRNVTRIKDIKYSISESAEANTIDAEIVFYQGQSLID